MFKGHSYEALCREATWVYQDKIFLGFGLVNFVHRGSYASLLAQNLGYSCDVGTKDINKIFCHRAVTPNFSYTGLEWAVTNPNYFKEGEKHYAKKNENAVKKAKGRGLNCGVERKLENLKFELEETNGLPVNAAISRIELLNIVNNFETSLGRCDGSSNAPRNNCFDFDWYENGDIEIGEYDNNELNGKGMIIFSKTSEYAGHIYEGNFLNYTKNGFGKYSFSKNEYYEGEFLDNKFQGEGKYQFPDGSFDIGQFANNKLNGLASKYDARGILVEHGIYKNDVLAKAVKKGKILMTRKTIKRTQKSIQ